MSKVLFIIDPQLGFNHQSVSYIFDRILEKIPSFDGEIYILKFMNDERTNFHKQLDWKRFSEPHDTDLIDGFESVGAKIFEHSTYSCMTDEVKQALHDDGVTEIYFAGVFTDVCIALTAMEAFDMGYLSCVVTDLVETLHGKDVQTALIKSLRIVLGDKGMLESSQI
jgi:nicotinamidase-related amidase